MPLSFNADEVFAMAEQIEKNAAVFYRRAANLHPGANAALLLKLAAMEDGHSSTFMQMRRGLSAQEKESTIYDPDGETALYLDAMANAHGGEGSPDVAASLTGKESIADILQTAIDLEQKSVMFYLGLRDVVPLHLGKDRVDHIIQEEKNHIVLLSRELRAVRKG